MASVSPPALLDLSNELLHRICRHLSFADLLNLLLTCRRLHGLLISDMSIWRPLQYQLRLNSDVNQNIAQINSLMSSPLFSFCTRLHVEKYSNEESETCIPTPFFSYLLPALLLQIKELCLLHLWEDDEYRFYARPSNCSQY